MCCQGQECCTRTLPQRREMQRIAADTIWSVKVIHGRHTQRTRSQPMLHATPAVAGCCCCRKGTGRLCSEGRAPEKKIKGNPVVVHGGDVDFRRQGCHHGNRRVRQHCARVSTTSVFLCVHVRSRKKGGMVPCRAASLHVVRIVTRMPVLQQARLLFEKLQQQTGKREFQVSPLCCSLVLGSHPSISSRQQVKPCNNKLGTHALCTPTETVSNVIPVTLGNVC